MEASIAESSIGYLNENAFNPNLYLTIPYAAGSCRRQDLVRAGVLPNIQT